MKKILYMLLAGVMALSSCSKSDDVPTTPQSDATTFTLAVDGVETRATSTITPTRYVMEVWSEDGLTAENVFENGTTNHAQITTGSAFTVTLDKTKAYTCLFWADDNTTFNAASLKAISLNAGKDVTEAYFSKVAVAKGKNPAVAVTLKRAVAKITLTEAATVKVADDIALKLSNVYPTFSVMDGAATGTAAEWTKTIKPAATTGTIATLYFFAKSDKELSDLTFTYAAEASKTVSNIPVRQNFATSIKGEYSNVGSFTFNVTADDVWNTPDNDVELPKPANVGDFYYKNGTWSSTYKNNAQNPCIGIVFVVNPDGKTGKIVSLDEPAKNWNGGSNSAGNLMWSTEAVVVEGATNKIDGAVNTNAVLTLEDYTAAKYPAFAWCATKNTPAIIGINWYLPASKELCQLYTAMCGLKWIESGIAANGEIVDWNYGESMPDYSNYQAICEKFNEKFTTANGTIIDLAVNPYYWASDGENVQNAYYVTTAHGHKNHTIKNFGQRVRAISVF